MPKAAKTSKPTVQTVRVDQLNSTNPDNVRPVYTNNATVMYAPHDFRLIFTEVVLTGPAGLAKAELQLRANISMSHTHFKALVKAMAETLIKYEQQFGNIEWPPKEKLPVKSLKM